MMMMMMCWGKRRRQYSFFCFVTNAQQKFLLFFVKDVNDDDDEIELLLLLLLLIACSFSFPGLKVAFAEEEMREEKTIDDIPRTFEVSKTHKRRAKKIKKEIKFPTNLSLRSLAE
jgi:hypothetical protein